MPTVKKRSGKSTITLYAAEERQIRGAIETMRFIELNDQDGRLGSNAGVISSGLAAVLLMLDAKAIQASAAEEGDREANEAYAEHTQVY